MSEDAELTPAELAEMERLALEAAVAEARAQVAAELRAWRLALQDRLRAETAERKRRLGA